MKRLHNYINSSCGTDLVSEEKNTTQVPAVHGGGRPRPLKHFQEKRKVDGVALNGDAPAAWSRLISLSLKTREPDFP
jgi:hypothetical protein